MLINYSVCAFCCSNKTDEDTSQFKNVYLSRCFSKENVQRDIQEKSTSLVNHNEIPLLEPIWIMKKKKKKEEEEEREEGGEGRRDSGCSSVAGYLPNQHTAVGPVPSITKINETCC